MGIRIGRLGLEQLLAGLQDFGTMGMDSANAFGGPTKDAAGLRPGRVDSLLRHLAFAFETGLTVALGGKDVIYCLGFRSHGLHLAEGRGPSPLERAGEECTGQLSKR